MTLFLFCRGLSGSPGLSEAPPLQRNLIPAFCEDPESLKASILSRYPDARIPLLVSGHDSRHLVRT